MRTLKTALTHICVIGGFLIAASACGETRQADPASPSPSSGIMETTAPARESARPTEPALVSPPPSPSASTAPSASPTPAPEPSNPSAASSAPKAEEASKPAKQAAAGDRKALSWYFVKKGPGKVPDFPADTKKFKPSDKAVWIGSGKKVYLTFDTGGPMGDTDKLLQTLKSNNIKASFFISGANMKAHPEFLKRLVADGHLVADHTMTHRDLTKLSDEEVKKEINDFAAMYKDITGREQPKYFRFPYGAYSLHLLDLVSDMGYTSVFWSTAMRDWEPRKNGAEDAYNDVMNMLHDGNIILMHQGSEENINALDRIIKAVKEKGYTFSLVTDF